MINGKYYKILLLFIILFIGSISVKAEEKCSDDKINQLKKQIEKVSLVSNFDDDALKDGILDANIITLYDLPRGFFVRNEDYSVIFDASEIVDGSITKSVGLVNKNFGVYSEECPNQVLKEFKVEVKRINPFYNSTQCEGIKEGELDVCDKFYDKEISYKSFLRKVEKYKKNNNIVDNTKKESFVEINKLIIGIISVIVLVIFGLVITNNIKKNKLD